MTCKSLLKDLGACGFTCRVKEVRTLLVLTLGAWVERRSVPALGVMVRGRRGPTTLNESVGQPREEYNNPQAGPKD